MKGFTLIEILAAAGILAVLAILIHGSFNISASIWQKRQQYMEQEQDARISMAILRQKISCAYRSPWHKKIGFDGSQHEIKFNTATSDGISQLRFYLKDDCLWLEETSVGMKTPSSYKLCAGVTRFDIFYGRTLSDNWSQKEQKRLPPLVKVWLELTHVDIHEMVIQVRTGKDYE